MKALGLVVSDKKIFENCILKTYFLTPWPTYATNQNHLNNFGRGPPRDHSCDVWSKSNEWFQRKRSLSKKVYGQRTTDDGQRPVTIAHPEHFVLRWANNFCIHKYQPLYSASNWLLPHIYIICGRLLSSMSSIKAIKYKVCVFLNNLNKRAQRALGRSPEEKVKGQGEANYIIITKYW